MARDPSFAPPLSSLATPTLGPPGVAVYPTGGQGLSLDERGIVPASASGDRELAYKQFVSDVTVSGASDASPTNVVSSGSIPYDGSPIKVEFFSPRILNGVGANAVVICSLFDGATQIGRVGQVQIVSDDLISVGFYTVVYSADAGFVHTPGVHEYNWKASRTVANGTIHAGSGGSEGNLPGYIRVSGVVR